MSYPVSYRNRRSQNDEVRSTVRHIGVPAAGVDFVAGLGEIAFFRFLKTPVGATLASRFLPALAGSAVDVAGAAAGGEVLAVVGTAVSGALFLSGLFWPRHQAGLSGPTFGPPLVIPSGWTLGAYCRDGNWPSGQTAICGAFFPSLKSNANLPGSSLYAVQYTDWDDSFPPNHLFWNATQGWYINETTPGVTPIESFFPKDFPIAPAGVWPVQFTGWDETAPPPLVWTPTIPIPLSLPPRVRTRRIGLPFGTEWGYDVPRAGVRPNEPTDIFPPIAISYPGARPVVKPYVVPYVAAAPRPWEREKKWKSGERTGRAIIALARSAQLVGHVDGIVRSIYDAIPGRRSGRSAGNQLAYIFDHFDQVDWRWASLNIISYEAKRRIAGQFYQAQVEAGTSVVGERNAWFLARGSNTVDGVLRHQQGNVRIDNKLRRAHSSFVWRHRRRFRKH